jgi:uncharacterized protein
VGQGKNRTNQRKHGVSFEEAAQVFLDPLHLSHQDRIEGGEQRWQTFGLSAGFVLLMVAHTIITQEEAGGDIVEVIRIISARRANRKEKQRYENENG